MVFCRAFVKCKMLLWFNSYEYGRKALKFVYVLGIDELGRVG